MATLQIYRGESELVAVKITDSTVYTCNLMAEDKVVAVFELPEAFGFAIGDYIMHNGQRYSLNVVPVEGKQSSRLFDYELEFEGPAYTLYNKLYQDEGSSTFSYFGTPEEFLLLLLTNINSLDSGWTIGDVEELEPIFIDFDGENCRQALTKIGDEFGLEYIIRGKEISLQTDIGVTVPAITLKYGKGLGLYDLRREKVDDQPIVTRLYGFGSSENIPSDYRDGVGRLTFEERYVDLNTELYGIREGVAIFEDIKPSFTGTLTGVFADDQGFFIYKAEDHFIVQDSGFPYNFAEFEALRLGGLTPKVVFKTGDLQGNEFDVAYYFSEGSIRFFVLRRNFESSGYVLPNATVKAAIGDEYTIVNIGQDASVVTAAEAAVKAATEARLLEVASPKARYTLNIDEKYVRDQAIASSLIVGNRIHIEDADLGIDRAIRLQTISYPLVIPERIVATLSDIVSYTIAEKLLTGQARLRAIGNRINAGTIQANINAQVNASIVFNQIRDPSLTNIIAYNDFRIGSPENYFRYDGSGQTELDPNPISSWPSFTGNWLNTGRMILGDILDEDLERFGFYGTAGTDNSDIVLAQGALSLDPADILASPFNVTRDGYLTTINATLGDVDIVAGVLNVQNVGAGEAVSFKDAGALKFKSFADSLDIAFASDATEINAYLLPTAISDRASHTPVADNEFLIFDHVAGSLKKIKFSQLGGSKWSDVGSTGNIRRDSLIGIGVDPTDSFHAAGRAFNLGGNTLRLGNLRLIDVNSVASSSRLEGLFNNILTIGGTTSLTLRTGSEAGFDVNSGEFYFRRVALDDHRIQFYRRLKFQSTEAGNLFPMELGYISSGVSRVQLNNIPTTDPLQSGCLYKYNDGTKTFILLSEG